MSRPTSLHWLLVSLLLLAPRVAATADAPLEATTGPVHAADLYVPGELVVKLGPGGDLAGLSELNARFQVRSAERASFDTWIKQYKPDENSVNSTVS